jgi:hypothetical protein
VKRRVERIGHLGDVALCKSAEVRVDSPGESMTPHIRLRVGLGRRPEQREAHDVALGRAGMSGTSRALVGLTIRICSRSESRRRSRTGLTVSTKRAAQWYEVPTHLGVIGKLVPADLEPEGISTKPLPRKRETRTLQHPMTCYGESASRRRRTAYRMSPCQTGCPRGARLVE